MSLLYVILLSTLVVLCHSADEKDATTEPTAVEKPVTDDKPATEEPKDAAEPAAASDARDETDKIYQVKSTLKGKSSFIYMDRTHYDKEKAKYRRKDGPKFRMLPKNTGSDICPGKVPWQQYISHGKRNEKLEHRYVASAEVKLPGTDFEHQGVVAFCAPALGECGADQRIYTKRNAAGKKKNDIFYSYHASKSNPGAGWEETDCYVWSM